MTRRTLLKGLALSALPARVTAPASAWPVPEGRDFEFLEGMVRDLLLASQVAPGSHGPANWPIPNTVGFPLFTPGLKGYPALWVRDFSMAAESGLVSSRQIEAHFRLIASCQNGKSERRLRSGATIPPYSIPDHINFDGSPVFFPGTYSSGEDQGNEPFGALPPMDDHFEFIHLAFLLYRSRRLEDLLAEEVAGLRLIERVKLAFEVPEVDPDTGLCMTRKGRRAVGFGFCDGIVLTGMLLYPSLLRWRAAHELAQLTGDNGYRRSANRIRSNIPRVFKDENTGWLLAATEVGRQPDVWGTLHAIELGILDAKRQEAAIATVSEAFRAGTIALEAGVRHVPTDRDFSAASAWESTFEPKGTYQNGAYWHTASGWLLRALLRADRTLARSAFREYVDHLRKNDYRLGNAGLEAPWECFGPNGQHRQNGGYLASVALPYRSVKRDRARLSG